MRLISIIYSTIIEALFPTDPAERAVLAFRPEEAFRDLPRAKNMPIREACSIFAYKHEMVSRLIWSLKYKKSRKAAGISAYVLYQFLRRYSQTVDHLIVVPMPITKRRRRERGYNQCELIADELKKIVLKSEIVNENQVINSSGDSNILIIRNLLRRVRHTSRQTMKDRQERLESIEEVFAVNNEVREKLLEAFGINASANYGDSKPNYLVIVIDDVITTGSTIRDAIFTLRQAGFQNTFGLSVAH